MRAVVLFGVATLAVAAVLGVAGVKGYEYGDSSAFCGLACHSVMKPQYDTYLASSHARVDCVRCHIGPGTGWFVRSKLSGANQLVAYTLNTYPRPIPAPDREPAPEPRHLRGVPLARARLRRHVSASARPTHPDEDNTRRDSSLVFRVGGGLSHSGGIHWHIANEVWYLPQDFERQDMAWVAVKGKDGSWTEYVDPTVGARPSQADVDARARKMDCIDCHNRSAHDVRPYADEVDRALTEGRLDATLPFLKKQALDLGPRKLEQPSAENTDEVLARIATLPDYYQKQQPAVYKAKQQSIEQRGRRALGHLPAVGLPGDADGLEHLRRQHRSRGHARLLPLPRRADGGRVARRPGRRSAPAARPATTSHKPEVAATMNEPLV